MNLNHAKKALGLSYITLDTILECDECDSKNPLSKWEDIWYSPTMEDWNETEFIACPECGELTGLTNLPANMGELETHDYLLDTPNRESKERSIARLLHKKTCKGNHSNNSVCTWYLESWITPYHAKKKYLEKAKKLIGIAGYQRARQVIKEVL